jgi:hypothetical protein
MDAGLLQVFERATGVSSFTPCSNLALFDAPATAATALTWAQSTKLLRLNDRTVVAVSKLRP